MRRRIFIKKERLLALMYIVVLITGIALSYSKNENEVVQTFAMPASKKIVIIDAGHGGWEPYANS